MKNKLFKSIGLAVLLLILLVSNVFAFSFGTTDGVWKRIDPTLPGDREGAECERYGAVTTPTYTLIDGMGVAYNVSVGPGGENERFIRNANVCKGNTNSDYAFATNNPAGWTRSVPDDNNRWTGFRSYESTCSPNVENLIISRYVYQIKTSSGGWNPTITPARLAIEIYNNTGDSISLSGYSLLLFTGDKEFRKIDLSGEIDNGAYYVVGTSDTVSDLNLTLTGNDAQAANVEKYRSVVLVKDYVYGSVDQYRDHTGDHITDVYNLSLTDENQVRYGGLGNSCPVENSNETTEKNKFLSQSGFGFQGMPASSVQPAVDEKFPIGRFCHYNNPVSSNNAFESVDLSLKISNIACPDNQTIVPSTGDNKLTQNFSFTAALTETGNAGEGSWNPKCEFGPGSTDWPSYGGGNSPTGGTGLNRNGCADRVIFSPAVDNATFTCVIDPNEDTYLEQEYHLSLLGFSPTTVGGACPKDPVGTLHFNQVYTAEATNNCFCVYAAYTKMQITPVTLARLGANWTDKGVLIDWETVTETNNFGFNIMRAESVDGERIQINPEMIFSSHAPGDPFGSTYEYLDETAVPGTEYFYWLVDVPLDSSEPGIYGPISPAG